MCVPIWRQYTAVASVFLLIVGPTLIPGCGAQPAPPAGNDSTPTVTGFTISGKTFAMKLGKSGEFDLSADGASHRTGAAIELFQQTPTDAPANCTLFIESDAVAATEAQASTADPVTIAVSIASAQSTNPCTDGTVAGEFTLSIESGVVALLTYEIALNGEALSLVKSGRFTICLEAAGDINASLDLSEVGVRFGPATGGDTNPDPDPGGDDPDPPVIEVPAEVFFEMNPDPEDPLIGRIVNDDTGHTATLYGQKDETGKYTKVEQVEFRDPDMADDEPGYAVLLDENNMPSVATGPNGESATFTYDGDTVTADFYDADGRYHQETVQLEPGTVAKAIESAAKEAQHAAKRPMRTIQEDNRTTVKIQGRINLFLRKSLDQAPHRDPSVRIKPTCKTGTVPPLALLNPNTDRYEFTITHRVKPIEARTEDCERLTGGAGTLMTVVGFMALVVTTFATQGATLVPLATKLSALTTVTGMGLLDVSLFCREYVLWSEDVQKDEGRTYVFATVSSNRADPPETQLAAEYDLYNPKDSIVNEEEFEREMAVIDCAGYREDIADVLNRTPNMIDAGFECELAKTEDEAASYGCLREPWDTGGMSVSTYQSDIENRIEQYCKSIDGCWRMMLTPTGGQAAAESTFIYVFDTSTGLRSIWDNETYGLLEAYRFAPLANYSKFAELYRNGRQSVVLTGDTHVSIDWSTDIWENVTKYIDGEEETRLLYTSSLTYQMPNLTIDFDATPVARFTGTYTVSAKRVGYDEGWQQYEKDPLQTTGNVTGTRVDCPDSDQVNIYSQEEQVAISQRN